MGIPLKSLPPAMQEQAKRKLAEQKRKRTDWPEPVYIAPPSITVKDAQTKPPDAAGVAIPPPPLPVIANPTPGSVQGNVERITMVVMVTPMGAPRMTQRDKWAKRDKVVRHRAVKDTIREGFRGVDLTGAFSLSWVAYFPFPKSYSKKKRARLTGQLHQLRPDRDNCDKLHLDALFPEDAGIATGTIEKRWDDGQGARIEFIIERMV